MSLTVTGLTAGYGGTPILRDVDCRVDDGEVVGIVGKNGVGKTTLLKTVMGLLDADSGTVEYRGETIDALSADERAGLGIGYVPQGRDVFPGLSVRENLLIGENIGDETEALYDRVYEYFPILEERSDQDAATMSGGQQQMLAIGRALVGNPDLLLVDEPSEGVQPSIVQSITEDLARINEEFGTTILFVEQNLSVIQGLADRCYAMDKGRLVDELDAEAIQDRGRLESHLVV